jgi:urease accessory protein UreF
MRRAILAGAVATTVLSGAAAGLILGVPASALSGERPASTPGLSILTAITDAVAAGVPPAAAPAAAAVQTGVAPVTSALAAAPAIAPAAASALGHVSTAASTAAKVAANTGAAATGGELSVVATALHMALSDLKAALAQGESMAQIATAAGIDPAKLISSVVDDATSKINAAVTLGKLARAHADKIIAMLPSLVADVVNHAFGDFGADFGPDAKLPFSPDSLGKLANLGDFASLGNPANFGNLANPGNLGNLSGFANLGSAAKAGDFSSFFSKMFGSFGSFGKMAGQAGAGATPDPQALISSLVSMATAAVNAAVSAGMLTPAQANMILASLTEKITTLVHKLLDASLKLESDASGWASMGSAWFGNHHH